MPAETSQQIEELVAKYHNLTQTERRDYNEANTKNVFVHPLFKALGWDFTDINQIEAEKTIIKGRVDYVFEVNRVSKFCLEIKPLREELTDDHRIQAISYAYNKGVTWAVLTNFDKLQVFNAERKTTDLNSVLFLNLSYRDYLTHLDDLRLLSRELIINNALDRFAERYGRLALRIPVEKRLYEHLRKSRERLFNEIYLHNKDRAITLEITDRLIQELFNRLLFIRTAEDRDLAGNHPLLAALHRWQGDVKGELVQYLRHVFQEFAQLYDSDLFPSLMDPWEQISVDSHLLADIIDGLYNVPGDFARYDFAAIDADVLGQVYEQYLGYIAQVAKEEAKKQQRSLFPELEEKIEIITKREKRKAAGIYYTPKWVTDCIVRQTLGRFIDEQNHNDIVNIKILDPACGSGSFLIRAYDELLTYHAKVESKAVADLDWTERMEILTRNIFGVDLDPQAVDIARLNLLIRALAERRSLPPLTKNIKCGNTVISGSDEELQRYFGDNFKDRKPFNWNEEFKSIMNSGGFDIVIGNPPWVSLKGKFGAEDFTEAEIDYLTEKYGGDTYRPNMIEYFIKRSLALLKEGGVHGFVIPDRLFANLQFEKLRRQMLESCRICSLIHRVPFPGTIADAAIYVVKKGIPPDNWEITMHEWGGSPKTIPQAFYLKSADYSFVLLSDQRITNIMDKIESSQTVPLGRILKSNVGFIAKRGKVTEKSTSQDDVIIYKGKNVQRYAIEGHFYFNFLKSNLAGGTQDVGKLGIKEKILLRKTGGRIYAALDKSGNFPEQSLYFLYVSEDKGYDLRYILALLNSRLLNCFYRNRLITNRDTMPQLKKVHLDRFPIRSVDFSNSADKKWHDELVALVDRMLELNRELIKNKEKGEDILGDKRKELELKIQKNDEEIGELVYQLYGMTDKDREIIETSS